MKLKKLFKIFKSKKNNSQIREYKIGDYSITLNKTHTLDKFQKQFVLYDRFLPIICSKLDGLIVDVGANIGDSTIAIFSKNSNSFIVGVEPDIEFYQKCLHNIKKNNLSERFFGVNKFVSTKNGSFVIKKNETNSTGYISENIDQDNIINTISFLDLMHLIPIDKWKNFDLLKIDTDGYDWDIIDSLCDFVSEKNIKPRFIFFEMQTFENNNELDQYQRNLFIENYNTACKNLKNIGYDYFCLFDNFGTKVKITNNLEDIFELNEYIKNSQITNQFTTIYYFDVLAFNSDDLFFVKQNIEDLYSITK